MYSVFTHGLLTLPCYMITDTHGNAIKRPNMIFLTPDLRQIFNNKGMIALLSLVFYACRRPHVCSGSISIIYIIPLSEHINASDEVMQLERETSGIPTKLSWQVLKVFSRATLSADSQYDIIREYLSIYVHKIQYNSTSIEKNTMLRKSRPKVKKE